MLGFSEKEIEVSVEPSRLTISGKRETETKSRKQGKTVYSEFCSDQILRVVDLPGSVDAEEGNHNFEKWRVAADDTEKGGQDEKRLKSDSRWPDRLSYVRRTIPVNRVLSVRS